MATCMIRGYRLRNMIAVFIQRMEIMDEIISTLSYCSIREQWTVIVRMNLINGLTRSTRELYYSLNCCNRDFSLARNPFVKYINMFCQKWDLNPRPVNRTATWTQRLGPLGHPDNKVRKNWKYKRLKISQCSRLEFHSLSELTRQIAPPTKNGHAPLHAESKKSSQSIQFPGLGRWTPIA